MLSLPPWSDTQVHMPAVKQCHCFISPAQLGGPDRLPRHPSAAAAAAEASGAPDLAPTLPVTWSVATSAVKVAAVAAAGAA